MTFHNPGLLALLLLLPCLALYDRRWGDRARAALRVSALADAPSSRPLMTWTGAFRLLGLALLLIALARPQRGQERREVLTPAADILLVLDTSGSMAALDFQPKNRLEAALEVLREFIKSRASDRLGLVVFSGLAYTQCPLTTDHGALLGFLDRVKMGMIQEDGTAIGSALAVATARLKDSAAKSKVIVLLTDGRNNRGEIDPVTAAKAAGALGIKIYAVGAGAPGGALYPVQDPFFGARLVRLPEELDEESLRRVAESARGRYFRAKDLESLRDTYREIDRMEKTEIKSETYAEYEDLYGPFLWVGFLVLAAEALIARTLLRRFP